MHAVKEPRDKPLIEAGKARYHEDMLYYLPIATTSDDDGAGSTPQYMDRDTGVVVAGRKSSEADLSGVPTADIHVASKYDAPESERTIAKRRERELRRARTDWRYMGRRHQNTYMAPNMTLASAAASVAAIQIFSMEASDEDAGG